MKSTRPYLRTFFSTLLLIALLIASVTAPVVSAAPAEPATEGTRVGLWEELLHRIQSLLPRPGNEPSSREPAAEDGHSETSAPGSETSQGEGGPSIDPLG